MVANAETQNNRFNPVEAIANFWKKNAKYIVPPVVAILIFFTLWQLLYSSGITQLPGPLSIITDERTRMLLLYPFFDFGGLDKGLFWQTWASLQRVAIGYIAAAIVGIALGIIVGLSDLMYRALDPIFQFLRTVPPLAWVPISLAALQQNEPAALFVIFITAIWPILINTTVGVQQIPQDYINVRRVLKLSNQKFFSKILIPSALPYIFTGLRIAIGLAWLAIIAAEIVMSGIVGIGFFIWDAYQNNYVSEIILALFYIGAVGLILDRGMAYLQNMIVPADRR
jgi:bicarbonate transport system permease protein